VVASDLEQLPFEAVTTTSFDPFKLGENVPDEGLEVSIDQMLDPFATALKVAPAIETTIAVPASAVPETVGVELFVNRFLIVGALGTANWLSPS
jgi:hypothetical protein